MKIKIDKGTVKDIALMSIPAAGLLPVSVPVAVLAAIIGGLSLTKVDEGQYEVEILSFKEWTKLISAAHLAEEEQKRLKSLYWRKRMADKSKW